jgi:hypothetical protein
MCGNEFLAAACRSSSRHIAPAREAVAVEILTRMVMRFHRDGHGHERIRASFDEIYPDQPTEPRLRTALDQILANLPPNQ